MWIMKITRVIPAILIMMPGVWSGPWSVTFDNPNPCAVRGSSAVFRCSYDYPDGETVNMTTWSKGGSEDGEWIRTSLSKLPSYQSRVAYLGDKLHNCSLAIHNLQDNDTGYYYFRYDTNLYGWHSKRSVYLSVTGLTASIDPYNVTEGDKVTLTCATSCTPPTPIVWFRGGQPVANPKFQARREDAGSFQCAVEGQETIRSDPVVLNVLQVEYPPVSVLVEVSPSGGLAEGSSVNLTCSSDANPAADSYTWYRGTGPPGSSSLVLVGSGQVLSLASLERSQTGWYFCLARNSLGERNSTELLLDLDVVTGINRLILRVSIGVKILVILVLPFAMVWAWRRQSSTVEKEEDSPDYINITERRHRKRSFTTSAIQDTRIIEERLFDEIRA